MLHMLGQRELAARAAPGRRAHQGRGARRADALGLRTAAKPDSQDVCFITSAGGRREFLGDRMSLHPGRVVDTDGREVGAVDAVELVTVGQRRGLGAVAGERSYAIDVDVAGAVVTVGRADDLLTGEQQLGAVSFVGDPFAGDVLAQCSAHGEPRAALLEGTTLVWTTPQRRVAPGQSIAFYDISDTELIGGATAA